jgi:hypothetical protein
MDGGVTGLVVDLGVCVWSRAGWGTVWLGEPDRSVHAVADLSMALTKCPGCVSDPGLTG